MPKYILFSLIAALGFSIAGIINKFASKHVITKRWPLLFWYYLTFIPFVLIIPFLAPITIPTTGHQWVFIAAYSLAFLVGNICFFSAIFQLDVSVISPFFQLQAAFLAVLAYLFLGERFPLDNYFWIAVLLIGALIVSIDEKLSIGTFFNKPILLIIAMQLFHAGANLAAGFILKFTDYWNLMWWTSLVSIMLVLVFISITARLRVKVTWSQLKPMFAINAVSFIAALSLFRAFQENVTLSGAISLLTGPMTFLIAITLSKIRPGLLEHHTEKAYLIRGLGTGLTLLGAVMLSI